MRKNTILAILIHLVAAVAFLNMRTICAQPQGGDFRWAKPPEISATGWMNTKRPLTLKKLRKRKAVMLVFWSSG